MDKLLAVSLQMMYILRIYIFYIEAGGELNAFFVFNPFVLEKEDAIEDMLGSLVSLMSSARDTLSLFYF